VLALEQATPSTIRSGGGLTVREKVLESVLGGDAESLTPTVKVVVPWVVGVPVMSPPADRDRPSGREPDVRVQV
jgi:hypothetical protein